MGKIFTIFLVCFLFLSGCFFPTNESALSNVKSSRHLAQLAEPLFQHMTITLNGIPIEAKDKLNQVLDSGLQAQLTIIPLSRTDINQKELPCVAGFLRVDNLTDLFNRVDSAQICYEELEIKSQLYDVTSQITSADNRTCISFGSVQELAPKGDPGDFATMVWYVCQTEANN